MLARRAVARSVRRRAGAGAGRASAVLHFVHVIGEYVAEARPRLLRYGHGGAVIRLHLFAVDQITLLNSSSSPFQTSRYHLGDAHVDAAVVLPDVKVKVLVFNAQVSPLGQLA